MKLNFSFILHFISSNLSKTNKSLKRTSSSLIALLSSHRMVPKESTNYLRLRFRSCEGKRADLSSLKVFLKSARNYQKLSNITNSARLPETTNPNKTRREHFWSSVSQKKTTKLTIPYKMVSLLRYFAIPVLYIII